MTPTHTALAGALLLVATGPLAACGTGTSAPTHQRVSVTIKGSQVSPSPHQVDLGAGSTLTLTVTSDHDDELHAHGFEVEKPIKAGVPLTITLKGAQPGVYEVETHHPPLRLLSVAVR